MKIKDLLSSTNISGTILFQILDDCIKVARRSLEIADFNKKWSDFTLDEALILKYKNHTFPPEICSNLRRIRNFDQKGMPYLPSFTLPPYSMEELHNLLGKHSQIEFPPLKTVSDIGEGIYLHLRSQNKPIRFQDIVTDLEIPPKAVAYTLRKLISEKKINGYITTEEDFPHLYLRIIDLSDESVEKPDENTIDIEDLDCWAIDGKDSTEFLIKLEDTMALLKSSMQSLEDPEISNTKSDDSHLKSNLPLIATTISRLFEKILEDNLENTESEAIQRFRDVFSQLLKNGFLSDSSNKDQSTGTPKKNLEIIPLPELRSTLLRYLLSLVKYLSGIIEPNPGLGGGKPQIFAIERGKLPHSAEDRTAYLQQWGFDADECLHNIDNGYYYEKCFPLLRDYSLKSAGLLICARVIVDEKGKSKNRIVFRHNNQSESVNCTHTKINNPSENLLDGEIEDIDGSQIEPGELVQLIPLEHFAALISYVQGLAEVGIQNLMVDSYVSSKLNPMVLKVGFNQAMQKQIVRCLIILVPDAAAGIIANFFGEMFDNVDSRWIEQHWPILDSTYLLSQVVFRTPSFFFNLDEIIKDRWFWEKALNYPELHQEILNQFVNHPKFGLDEEITSFSTQRQTYLAQVKAVREFIETHQMKEPPLVWDLIQRLKILLDNFQEELPKQLEIFEFLGGKLLARGETEPIEEYFTSIAREWEWEHGPIQYVSAVTQPVGAQLVHNYYDEDASVGQWKSPSSKSLNILTGQTFPGVVTSTLIPLTGTNALKDAYHIDLIRLFDPGVDRSNLKIPLIEAFFALKQISGSFFIPHIFSAIVRGWDLSRERLDEIHLPLGSEISIPTNIYTLDVSAVKGSTALQQMGVKFQADAYEFLSKKEQQNLRQKKLRVTFSFEDTRVGLIKLSTTTSGEPISDFYFTLKTEPEKSPMWQDFNDDLTDSAKKFIEENIPSFEGKSRDFFQLFQLTGESPGEIPIVNSIKKFLKTYENRDITSFASVYFGLIIYLYLVWRAYPEGNFQLGPFNVTETQTRKLLADREVSFGTGYDFTYLTKYEKPEKTEYIEVTSSSDQQIAKRLVRFLRYCWQTRKTGVGEEKELVIICGFFNTPTSRQHHFDIYRFESPVINFLLSEMDQWWEAAIERIERENIRRK